MADIISYRHGRIVFAYLKSSVTGKREAHPAIILNKNDEIIQPERFDPRRSAVDNVVHVIGISTKHKSFAVPYVQLPFSSSGHATTRLREDCGAIIGWYHRVAIPDDVVGFGGDAPPAIMRAIFDLVRKDLVQKIGRDLGTLTQLFNQLHGNN